MLRTRGWLCLAVVFVLLLASFFLPFEVIRMRHDADGGNSAYTNAPLNGYVLIENSAVLDLNGEGTAAVKKLTGKEGQTRSDLSYVYALLFVSAAVGLGVALLDRAGRHKAVSGILCSLIGLALGAYLVYHDIWQNVGFRADGFADWSFDSMPGAGLIAYLVLCAAALTLSVMILKATPKNAGISEEARTLIVTRVGVMAAIGGVLFTIPGIPVFPPIYKLDFSSVPVLLTGFSIGPIPALFVLIIKDLIGLLTSSSGGVGELADFMTCAALLLPSSILYQRRRTFRIALTGLAVGVAAMAAVGALVNWFIMIPFYVNVMGMPIDTVVGMMGKIIPAIDSLPKLILMATVPFNLIKGIVLTLVTVILYKRLSPLLKNA